MSSLSLKDSVIWLVKSFNWLILEKKFLHGVTSSVNIEKHFGIELSKPFSLADGSFAISVVPLQRFKDLFLIVGDSLQLTNDLKPNLGIGNILVGSRFYGVIIGKKELDTLIDAKVDGLSVWFTNYKHLYILNAVNKKIAKASFISEKLDSSGKVSTKEIFWHNLICKYDTNGNESYELKGVYDDSRS